VDSTVGDILRHLRLLGYRGFSDWRKDGEALRFCQGLFSGSV
jgi:hypothetical protein